MKIQVHYNAETGEILGYYPENVSYSSLPSPLISITREQYEQVFHNESKFRVLEEKLSNIEGTADYLRTMHKSFAQKAKQSLNSRAELALKYGVVPLNDNFSVNVGWLSYFRSMQALLVNNSPKEVFLRVYEPSNNDLIDTYESFKLDDAKNFVMHAIQQIENFLNMEVPERMNAYAQKLSALLESSQDVASLTRFTQEMDFGTIDVYDRK